MRFVAVFFALLVPTACSSGTTAPDAASSPVGGTFRGRVTDVTIQNGAVTRFELTTEDDTIAVAIDPERDYGFDLLHLEEHEATGDPVIVETEAVADDLVALSIEDA